MNVEAMTDVPGQAAEAMTDVPGQAASPRQASFKAPPAERRATRAAAGGGLGGGRGGLSRGDVNEAALEALVRCCLTLI